MKIRILLLFLLLLVLGASLRLWQLGNIPEGFYSDEALYGYEAYSLLKSGKDQFGNPYPLTIAGFGDFRPALYIYSTVPFISWFGLTEFATRLPSTLTSIVTLVVTFFLIRIITRSQRTALLGLLVLVLSPWSIFFGRMAHETNLMTLLIAAGTFFMWRARKCAFCVIPSALCFAASLYTYHSSRIFVPLFLILTIVIGRSQIKSISRRFIIGSLIVIVALLPLVGEFTKTSTWSRVEGVGFWNDPGIVSYINEARGKVLEKGWPTLVIKVVYNRPVVYTIRFAKNFLSHFDPKFLLTVGDPNGVYNTPHTGILLWPEIILLPLGFIIIYQRHKKMFWWLLFTVGLTLLPDTLTRIGPSSARIHLALPFLAIVSAVALRTLLAKQRYLFLSICVLLILSNLWFWKNYLVDRVTIHEEAWQVGAKELMAKIVKHQNDYPKIWISRYGYGWIHLVFRTQYDPVTLQKEIRHSEPNELGFWWVSDVGPYHLDWLPNFNLMDCVTLYVAPPTEFQGPVRLVDSVQNLSGKDIFWFAQKTECQNLINEFNLEGYL